MVWHVIFGWSLTFVVNLTTACQTEPQLVDDSGMQAVALGNIYHRTGLPPLVLSKLFDEAYSQEETNEKSRLQSAGTRRLVRDEHRRGQSIQLLRKPVRPSGHGLV